MTRRRTALVTLLLLLAAAAGGGAWLAGSAGDGDAGSGTRSGETRGTARRGDINDVTREPVRERIRVGERPPERPADTVGATARAPDFEPAEAAASAELAERARTAARAAVEALRNDTHRDKMRVVWPSVAPPPPDDGAEIVVLRGYRGLTLARVVWRGGVAEGTWLANHHDWTFDEDATRLGAARFTVDPERFVVAWTAARLVLGARAERREPPPANAFEGSSGWSSSHEAHLVARIREGDATLHAFDQRGGTEHGGVRVWDEIRDRAIHALLAQLQPEEPDAREPLTIWLPFLNATLEELGQASDASVRGPDRLLRETVLRAVGDGGDARSLALLPEVGARLSPDDDSWYAQRTRELIADARTRLGLRLRWSAERAEAVLRDGETGAKLEEWVRRRFLAVDPGGYRDALVRMLLETGLDTKLVLRAQQELERLFPGAAQEALTPLLDHADPAVRVDAALALAERGGRRALDVLREAAADPSIRRPVWQSRGDWPRALAIRHLVSRGEWGPDELRERVLVRREDGALVELVEDLLRKAGEPLTDVEAREAYRGVLDGPRDGGTLIAIRRLIELDDRPSFERMRRLLDEMSVAPREGEMDPVGTSRRRFVIPDLLEMLDDRS